MSHSRNRGKEAPPKPARGNTKPIALDAGLNPKNDTAEVRIPESDPSKLMAAVTQDRECFQRANDWLKSEAERWSNIAAAFQKTKKVPMWKDPFGLTLVTFVTLIVLAIYTDETYKLRVTAEAQLDTQTLPVVVLGSQDDGIAQKNTIVVRNVGLGPALNAWTAQFTIDHGQILTKPSAKNDEECKDLKDTTAWEPASGPATVQLNHRTAIAVGETHDIDGEERISGEKAWHRIFQEMCMTPPYKRVTPISNMVKLIADEKLPKAMCIMYESARGDRYETWQTFNLPSPNNLAIDFICHRALRDEPGCTSGRIQQVQKKLDQLNGGPLADACPAKEREGKP